MKSEVNFPKSMIAALLTAVLLTGCPQTETKKSTTDNQKTPSKKTAAGDQKPEAEAHDSHDVPLTDEEKEQLRKDNEKYEDAVAHIQSYRDTIRTETTGGDPAKAHRALDNLDLVLKWLPEIAQKSGIPKSKLEEINTTAQKLRELFNSVHADIDAGKKPDYTSVADEIDQAIGVIAAIKAE